jgi:hypothetical protein
MTASTAVRNQEVGLSGLHGEHGVNAGAVTNDD